MTKDPWQLEEKRARELDIRPMAAEFEKRQTAEFLELSKGDDLALFFNLYARELRRIADDFDTTAENLSRFDEAAEKMLGFDYVSRVLVGLRETSLRLFELAAEFSSETRGLSHVRRSLALALLRKE